MRVSPRVALGAYLLLMFATLPLLPPLVTVIRDGLGAGRFSLLLYGLLAALLLPPLWLLLSPPRPRPPWPHLSLCLLALLTAAVLGTLVSSPVGRVHLAEYGLLAILILRALPRTQGAGPVFAAFAIAAGVGLADETVQHFLPNRVFDWYDVGLNAAAALLGLLASVWWRRTSLLRGGRSSPGVDPDCG